MRGPLLTSIIVTALGAGVMFVSMRRYQEQADGGASVQVVIVREDVSPGQVITEEMLGVRAMPEAYVESRHVRPDEVHTVLGLRARAMVETNQSLLWSDVESADQGARELSRLVRSGVRAVTVDVDAASAFDGLLRAGDRVDVFHSTDRESEGNVTVPLLQNMLVLAARRAARSARPST
jgi:pilus assembly protein CpaB